MTTESTLANLIVPKTRDQVLDDELAALALSGLQTTDWSTTSVPRRLLVAMAEVISNLWSVISSVAKGGLLETATGQWLDLLAYSVYQETRQDAVAATGTCKIQDFGGGPFSISPGGLWFCDSTGVHRYNYTGVGLFYTSGGTPVAVGTLPKNGHAYLEVLAERSGAEYNVETDGIDTLQTTLPGVSFLAGESSYNPAAGWITRAGVDEEDDASLRLRCRQKWGTLGSGANEYSYEYWAKMAETSTPVTRSRAISNPDGYAFTVSVFVASAAGLMSSDDKVIIDNALVSHRPACVLGPVVNPDTMVADPTLLVCDISGTVYAYAAYAITALDQVRAALTTFFGNVEIGQNIYLSQVLSAATYSQTELQYVNLTITDYTLTLTPSSLIVMGSTAGISVVVVV